MDHDDEQGGRGGQDDLSVPTEPVDLEAAPGTEEHDRAQEAVMYEGATAASTETPEPTGTAPDSARALEDTDATDPGGTSADPGGPSLDGVPADGD